MNGQIGTSWDPTSHYKDIQIAERYDRERFSSLAGRVFNALEKRTLRRAFARVPRTARILDVPCGTGRMAQELLRVGYKVVGADISPAMLDVAGRKLAEFGDRFTAIVGDVRELARTQAGQYDAALCARVLMHFELPQQIEFLRAVATLSRGTVVFTQSFSTPYQRMRRRVKHVLRNADPANYPITEQQLRRLLDGAGLREVRRLRVASLISEALMVVAEHK
ncbi:MAG TPA: methyltransferase domain-containing protein [Casimicrobiaceae bacterium]|nr:methyltransferase domain-containing protein [Casimicrobiaceae bacterium]